MPHTKALAVRYEDTGLPYEEMEYEAPFHTKRWTKIRMPHTKALASVTKTQAFPTKRWNTKRPSIRRDGIRSALPYEELEYEAPFHTKRLNTKRLMIITKPQGLPYEELEYEELNIDRTRGFSNTRVVTTKLHRNEHVTSKTIL